MVCSQTSSPSSFVISEKGVRHYFRAVCTMWRLSASVSFGGRPEHSKFSVDPVTLYFFIMLRAVSSLMS